ncbi:MAG: MBL fold metallo-hydrolase [Clostridia bacterium]|nr:MBL fold metallo-hydrolase [Clostridia bacterium]
MRINKIKALAVFLAFSFVLVGCSADKKEEVNGDNGEATAFVTLLDVEKSECILSRLPDGKILLVDSGNIEDFPKVKKALDKLAVSKIDYFVLTHPDLDHVGCAEKVISEYEVGCLYTPKIIGSLTNLFPDYKSAVALAKRKGVQIKISATSEYFKGEGYSVAFLSPHALDGIYADFNNSFDPTSTQVDDLSAVLYLDILGVRLVLTGDAGYAVEEQIVLDYNAGYFSSIYKMAEIDINLVGVDFLKVAKNGKDGATGTDFVSLLKPNSVLLPIGDAVAPSDLVLSRLYNVNPSYDLYRSDVYGNITINVIGDNTYQIITDKK